MRCVEVFCAFHKAIHLSFLFPLALETLEHSAVCQWIHHLGTLCLLAALPSEHFWSPFTQFCLKDFHPVVKMLLGGLCLTLLHSWFEPYKVLEIS